MLPCTEFQLGLRTSANNVININTPELRTKSNLLASERSPPLWIGSCLDYTIVILISSIFVAGISMDLKGKDNGR